MLFEKEQLNINQAVFGSGSEATVAGDIIVPDSLPDIEKTLQIDGRVTTNSVEVVNGKIRISGVLAVKILYMPQMAEGERGTVRMFGASFDFNHLLEANNVEEGSVVHAIAECGAVEFEIVNSRKISIRGTVFIACKATNNMVYDVITAAEDEDHGVETMFTPLKANTSLVEQSVEFAITEKIELARGKNSVAQMLRVDAQVMYTEARVVANKIILKGSAYICALYNSDNPEDTLQFMEYEMPYTEILEVPGAVEGARCEIDLTVKSVYHEVGEDSDGDMRMIGVEMVVDAAVRISNSLVVQALTDCYVPGFEVAIEKKVSTFEYIAFEGSAQLNLREHIALGSDQPQIKQMYNLTARPMVTETRLENGKLNISGVLDATILFLTEDENQPLFSFKKELPFNYSTATDTAEGDLLCDCAVRTLHQSYSLQGAGEIETRIMLGLDYKLCKAVEAELINNVTIGDPIETKLPSIVIYFTQPGDTLWQIAKRYNTTISKLMDMNGLTEESKIKKGMRVIIESNRFPD